MTFAQLHFFMEGIKERELEAWRHTRFIMWSNIAPNSKRKITPEQVLKIRRDTPKGRPISAEEYKDLKSKWYGQTAKA